MTRSSSGWNAIMQYSFIKVFATDGVIDAAELAMLERIALEDGKVDDEERAILGRVFSRVTAENTAPDVWAEIQRFKAEYSIP